MGEVVLDNYLKEIEIKGWRSFSPTGVKLKNLKKINLLIGPNNSGKSNIIRFFQSLKYFLTGRPTPNLIAACYMTEKDTWLNLSGDVTGLFKVIHKGEIHNFEIIRKPKENTEILLVDGESTGRSFMNWRHLIVNRISLYTDIRGFVQNTDSNRIEHRFGDTRVSDVIFKRGTYDLEWYKEYIQNMSKWLSKLMNEDVKLEVKLQEYALGQSPYVYDNILSKESKEEEEEFEKKFKFGSRMKRAEFEIRINKGGDELFFEPEELGRGILQFIILLSALYEQKSKEAIVFIEEPETNLHAGAIKELMDILENESLFENHQYFLITHSHAILDKINENYSVYRFEMEESGATSVVSCTTKTDNFSLLDLLGVNPSQMLLSNLVIWVEGPSDRIYINKWIEIYNNKLETNYIEGRNYSFIFYGGSLLDHYYLLDDEGNVDEFIDFLNISRYAAIVCDSDLGDNRTTYKNRVERIRTRLAEKSELNSYIFQWITDGREIENYVPKELFVEVISNKIRKRENFYYTKEKRRHYFSPPNPEMIKEKNFVKDLSFDKFFAEMYIRESELEDEDLREAIINNISGSFDKVLIANEVVKIWDEEQCGLINSDLDEKMTRLLELLKRASS